MTKIAWPGFPPSFPLSPDPAERGEAGATGATGATGDTGATGGVAAPAFHNTNGDLTLADEDAIVRGYGSAPTSITLPTATGNAGRTIRLYRYGAGALNIFAAGSDDIEKASATTDSGITLSGWSAELVSTGAGSWMTRLVA